MLRGMGCWWPELIPLTWSSCGTGPSVPETTTSVRLTAGNTELVQVQQGTVTIQAGDQSVTLKVGDAATFPGDVKHSYANPHAKPARFSLCVFEPGVGGVLRLEVDDA